MKKLISFNRVIIQIITKNIYIIFFFLKKKIKIHFASFNIYYIYILPTDIVTNKTKSCYF